MVTAKDKIPLEISASQSEIHGQAAWESPGLVKMQILGPSSGLLNQNSEGL